MNDDPLGIRIGGLMRCCIQTYERFVPPATVSREGDTLDCLHCTHGLIVRDGAWEWNQGYQQKRDE